MKIISLDTGTKPEIKSIAVGDSVILNEIEWTVAEDPDTKLTLYREDVDGKIQTLELDFISLLNKTE